MLDFTIGCGKVNCPSGQEKVPWGATSRRTAGKFSCTRAIVGGAHCAPAPSPTGCRQTILPLHDTFLLQNAKRYILPEKFMLY